MFLFLGKKREEEVSVFLSAAPAAANEESFFLLFLSFLSLSFSSRTSHCQQRDHPYEQERQHDDGEAHGVHLSCSGGS